MPHQRQRPGHSRCLPPQPGLPNRTPGRHQHRRRPERRGNPVQGPRPAGAAVHLPLQHRLPLPGRRLYDPHRRPLLDIIPGRLASLLPGVQAPRRRPQAGPGQAEELPPLLRQRLGRPGPRRAASLVLFVFETHDAEESFLRAAGAHRLPSPPPTWKSSPTLPCCARCGAGRRTTPRTGSVGTPMPSGSASALRAMTYMTRQK